MTAPLTPPYYADLLGGREEGLAPEIGVRWVLEDLAEIARYAPEWTWDERGVPVTLRRIAGNDHSGAEIGFSAGELSGTIRLVADESGYVRVEVSIAGHEVLRAYVDRPYEECAAHPAGAVFDEKRTVDPAARMGKKLSWLQLRASHWPELTWLDTPFMSFSVKE